MIKSKKKNFEITLAENGRKLIFDLANSNFTIQLANLDGSDTSDKDEVISYKDLCIKAHKFRIDFLDLAIGICPNYFNHSWVKKWRSNSSIIESLVNQSGWRNSFETGF